MYSVGMRFELFKVKLGVLAAAAFALSAHAQTPAPTTAKAVGPHFPTSEELRHLKAISSPMLSPDGKQVLFVVTESTADGGATHLWLAPTPAGANGGGLSTEKARQITFSAPSDKRGERAPQWTPDGQAIYFLAHRGEHTQLFRMDLRGGEASPYDFKVLPPVDESKLPGAIPPAGSEKTLEKTTTTLPASEKKPKKSLMTAKRQSRFRSTSAAMRRRLTGSGWLCGRAIRRLPARKSRRMPRRTLSGSTTRFMARGSTWRR